ncbi:MAG: restriction endonuclease subunit S, partial [Eubacterium sp.]|nr:restriction endonuclease subunit S [Eubacterium sp.]
LNKLELDIPCIEEQNLRADSLSKLEKIISLREEELRQLDDLIKARFVELFGDPVQNTKGWETDVCKNLTSKIGSGATPKGGRESYGTEGISLIRSMNVYNNRFEYKDLAYITDEQADKLSNVTIEENDVLLNITGASVARCCIVPNELLPARVNQHVSIVRCKDKLLPEFLCSMFTEDNYQKLLWSIATSGGSTREAIAKQQIEDLILIVPPIELQKQFMDFCKQVDKSKVVVQKVLENKIDSDMINTVTAETVELLRGNINFIRNGEH